MNKRDFIKRSILFALGIVTGCVHNHDGFDPACDEPVPWKCKPVGKYYYEYKIERIGETK